MIQRENGNEVSAVNVTDVGSSGSSEHWTVEDIARAKAAGLALDIERTNVIIVARSAAAPPLKFTGIVRDDAVRADLRKNRTIPPMKTAYKSIADPPKCALTKPAVPSTPDVDDLLKTILHWKGEAERLACEVTKLQARIANLSGNDGPLMPLQPLIGSSDVDAWQRRLDEFRRDHPRENGKARGRGRVIPPVVPHGPHGTIGSEPYVDEDGCWELPMDSQEMLDAIRRQLADEETARLAEEHKRKPTA